MKIARRTFILGTGLVATSTVLGSLLPRAAGAHWPASPLPESLPPRGAAGAASASGPVLRIEGWDLRGDAPAASAGDEVWISFNRSWQTAWR